MIAIDESVCKKCNLCAEACISGALLRGPSVDARAKTLCIKCGHCVSICPENAVSLDGFSKDALCQVPERPLISSENFMDFLRARRSMRKYRTEALSEKETDEILLAASLAPSAHNGRQVKAYIIEDPERMEKVRRKTVKFYGRMFGIFKSPITAFLWKPLSLLGADHETLKHAFEYVAEEKEGIDSLLYNAPSLLIFTAPRLNSMAAGDGWIAAQNAVLYAESKGLGTCYNGYLAMAANWSPGVRRALSLPFGERVVIAITIGYPERKFVREAPRRAMRTKRM